MPKPIRLGILVPSSNTSLEPLTTSIISSLPLAKTFDLTVHFSRLPVTSISLSASSTSQFNTSTILPAARLLADAQVDMIGWSGTSAGWLGFESDEVLCTTIESETGIRATTSVLALNSAIRALGVEKLGLVTPYAADVQEAIMRNYGGVGVEVLAERHLSVRDNLAIAEVGTEVLGGLVRGVVEDGHVQAVSTFCTNLLAAHRVVEWEGEIGVPVLDSVATVVWDMLRRCGVDTKPLAKEWGSLFEL